MDFERDFAPAPSLKESGPRVAGRIRGLPVSSSPASPAVESSSSIAEYEDNTASSRLRDSC